MTFSHRSLTGRVAFSAKVHSFLPRFAVASDFSAPEMLALPSKVWVGEMKCEIRAQDLPLG